MARRITDDRIGIKSDDGQVTKKPKRYVNGELLKPKERPTTTVKFGDRGQYFYYVPIGVRSTNKLRQQMEEIVGLDDVPDEDEGVDEENKSTSKAEAQTETRTSKTTVRRKSTKSSNKDEE